MIKQERLVFLLPIIFVVAFILFYPSFNYYFFQDDWFVLNWVRTGSFSSLLGIRSDIIYYRPIAMPLFFAICYKLFGLNPLPYHIIVFIIFLALIVAVFLLFKTLTNNSKLAIFVAFLYASWPIHFMGLSWLSTTSYILGPFFIVLSCFSFIKYLRHKKRFFYFSSFSLFLLALGSSEFALTLPAILLIWGFLIKRENYFKFLWPFFSVSFIYIILRIFVNSVPFEGQYQIELNNLIINNFVWYLAWAFGFPESFKDLISPNFAIQSFKNLIQFWSISVPSILLVLISIKLVIQVSQKNLKLIFLGIFWLIAGLSPVILFTNHTYSGYLSFAGLGFLYLLTIGLKSLNRIWWLLVGILWTISSINNLHFTYSTHWIRNEQAISRAYTKFAKETTPSINQDSAFLFYPADHTFASKHQFFLPEKENTLKQALNDQEAMKVVYQSNRVRSLFLKDNEKIDIPKIFSVYTIRPESNQE